MQALFLIFIGVGVLMFFIGRYINLYRRIELLSQYNKRKLYDRHGLAEFAGKNLMAMGFLITVVSIVFMALSFLVFNMITIIIFLLIYLVIVFVFSFRVALGCKRFEM